MSFRGLADFLRASWPLVAPTRAPYFSLLVQRKVSKRKHAPTSGSGLRPDFPPSGAASGAVTKGRPCPFVPRSASCLASPCATPPLGLLTGTMAPSCLKVFFRSWFSHTSHQAVKGAPSGGRVEMSRRGASRRDAARGITGQGWPVYAGPRSGIGRREPRRRRGRMSGGAFFCLLFFAQTKKSESPGGAKREVSVGSIIGLKANPSRLTQSCQSGPKALLLFTAKKSPAIRPGEALLRRSEGDQAISAKA